MRGNEPQESEKTAEEPLTEIEAIEWLRSHGPVEERLEITEPIEERAEVEVEFLLERSNGESS